MEIEFNSKRRVLIWDLKVDFLGIKCGAQGNKNTYGSNI